MPGTVSDGLGRRGLGNRREHQNGEEHSADDLDGFAYH
jgi:hypothetical protein